MCAHFADDVTSIARSAAPSPRVSVILPARNEARNLPYLLPHIPPTVDEVILVDGHSTDGTAEVAWHSLPRIRVVRQRDFGPGGALRQGIAASTGDILVVLDADGANDPREIPAFLAALRASADIATGSRFLPGGGSTDLTWVRRVGTRALSALANRLLHSDFTDLRYGYCAFWRTAWERIQPDGDAGALRTRLLLRASRAQLVIAEVPSFEHIHIHDAGALRVVRDGLGILRAILRERTGRAPESGEIWQAWTSMTHTTMGTVVPPGDRSEANPRLLPPADKYAKPTAAAAPATAANISVVLIAGALDRWEALMLAIESLRRQEYAPREVLLVVDHNAALLARARSRLPGAVVLASDGPPGQDGARNTGLLAARGGIVAFLDDDAVAAPDWLARLAAHFADPWVVGVGGSVVPLWQQDQPRWFPAEFGWVVGCGYRGQPQATAAVLSLSGCNVAFRRQACIAAGGFRTDDDRADSLTRGGHEVALCLRMGQRWPQYTLLYEPGASVYRHVPAQRTSWQWFRARCAIEGKLKARVAVVAGARDGLCAERAYLLHTVPSGMAHEIQHAVLRHDPWGLVRAGAIVAGCTITTSSFASAMLTTLHPLRRARAHSITRLPRARTPVDAWRAVAHSAAHGEAGARYER